MCTLDGILVKFLKYLGLFIFNKCNTSTERIKKKKNDVFAQY